MPAILCAWTISPAKPMSARLIWVPSLKKQGVSISDYITTQRINAACRYLTATNMTLKEISMKCGYANQYYFSTSFKKKWMSLHLHTEILRRQNLSFYLCFPITPCIIKTMSIIMTSFLYECAVNYLYRHYICFAENLSVAVVVNANILIIRRFKMG